MTAVLAPDPGPLARLEAVVAAEHTPSVVFQRVSEGETLRDVAKAWQVPVGKFTEWFMQKHEALYDAALKVRADQLAHKALEVSSTPQRGVTTKTKADGSVEVTEEDMLGHRKLYADTMLRLAGKWDRQRYGEQVQHQISGRAVLKVDFSRPNERLIENGDAAESLKISQAGEI